MQVNWLLSQESLITHRLWLVGVGVLLVSVLALLVSRRLSAPAFLGVWEQTVTDGGGTGGVMYDRDGTGMLWFYAPVVIERRAFRWYRDGD